MAQNAVAREGRRPLLVEFTGLPGAGKTTIARAVLPELARAGYRCVVPGRLGDPPEAVPEGSSVWLGKLGTLSGLISVSLRNPVVFFRALAYAWSAAPRSLVTVRRMKTLLCRLSVIEGAMDADCDLVVLDQGLIQNVWSITAAGDPPKDERGLRPLVERLLSGFSPLLVLVDIDVERAVERIGDRPTMDSRFDRMPAGRAAALLGRHGAVLERIVRCAAELPTIRCLRVDGGRPPTANVPLILDEIRNARR